MNQGPAPESRPCGKLKRVRPWNKRWGACLGEWREANGGGDRPRIYVGKTRADLTVERAEEIDLKVCANCPARRGP